LKKIIIALALVAATGGLLIAGGQDTDARQQARLKQLFPAAVAFSPKASDPPHYTAFGPGPAGNQPVLGYAFLTTDLIPLERGYGGPIVMLVGLDLKGLMTGLIVVNHREPYGDFSIDRPQFANQFRGKDVRDAFKLGEDIDAVSRATITMSSAVRAIRGSVRRAARTLLTAPPPTK
jgi:NosR/NirI family transcriptional regulator, nitrous oxide reductase regulator